MLGRHDAVREFPAPVFRSVHDVHTAAALLLSERVPERVAVLPPYAEWGVADVMLTGSYTDGKGRSWALSEPIGSISHRGRVSTVEGPRWRVEVGPGVVSVRSSDPVRAERARERARVAAEKAVALNVALAGSWVCSGAESGVGECFPGCRCGGQWTPPEGGVSRIGSWSAKSRSRMVQRLAELDYTPLLTGPDGEPLTPAMITLTYPGDWLAVVPSARVCRRHVRAFCERWYRRWGSRLVGVWKREFQRRGAPHLHLLTVPPAGAAFACWLSATWAEIVDADWCGGAEPSYGCRWSPGRSAGERDSRPLIVCCEFHRHQASGTGIDYHEGARVLDPKRLAIYFAKHGSFSAKEYQNSAPREWLHEPGCDDDACEGCAVEGVGRFWGVWGLERAVAVVEVAADTAATVRRVMRRWSQANRYYVPATVWRKQHHIRVDTSTGEITDAWRWRKRRSKIPVQHLRGRAGFLLVNDGPTFLEAVARLLARDGEYRHQRAHRLSDGRILRNGSGLGPRGFLP